MTPPPAKPSSQLPPRTDDTVEIIQPNQFIDRRAEPRVECDTRGAMLFLSSQEIVTCRILDQSPSGARVAFDNIARIPAEIWLIDLETNMVRRGAAAWSMPSRMGLKFNFVQTLIPGEPRPARIPESVYSAWLRLSGNEPPKDADDGDVLFLD